MPVLTASVFRSGSRVAACLLACAALGACGKKEAPLTVVSIEFDDSSADQTAAIPALAERGMLATFYVNSALLGTPGYLTMADIQRFAAAGHEIGGHTLHHANLPTLSPEEQAHEICDDRRALQARGLTVDTFAYPFGAHNEASKAAARACGYASARDAGGLCVSPPPRDAGSGRCDRAESIPPADLFELRTPGSVRHGQAPEGIERLVTDVEAHGGGWVQLIFHRLGEADNEYTTTPAQFAEFIRWLAGERDAGRVRILTAREVIRGAAPGSG